MRIIHSVRTCSGPSGINRFRLFIQATDFILPIIIQKTHTCNFMYNFKNILERESKGNDRIYLYREGNYWTGYEQSAHKLRKMIKGLQPKCHSINNAIWLTRVEIPFDSLPKEHIIINSKDECILDASFLA